VFKNKDNFNLFSFYLITKSSQSRGAGGGSPLTKLQTLNNGVHNWTIFSYFYYFVNFKLYKKYCAVVLKLYLNQISNLNFNHFFPSKRWWVLAPSSQLDRNTLFHLIKVWDKVSLSLIWRNKSNLINVKSWNELYLSCPAFRYTFKRVVAKVCRISKSWVILL